MAYDIEITDEADAQLTHEPAVEARNRKRMRPNPVAPWALRVGKIRVYSEVVSEPDPLVTVWAVGIKDRNQVTIGSVKVDLS